MPRRVAVEERAPRVILVGPSGQPNRHALSPLWLLLRGRSDRLEHARRSRERGDARQCRVVRGFQEYQQRADRARWVDDRRMYPISSLPAPRRANITGRRRRNLTRHREIGLVTGWDAASSCAASQLERDRRDERRPGQAPRTSVAHRHVGSHAKAAVACHHVGELKGADEHPRPHHAVGVSVVGSTKRLATVLTASPSAMHGHATTGLAIVPGLSSQHEGRVTGQGTDTHSAQARCSGSEVSAGRTSDSLHPPASSEDRVQIRLRVASVSTGTARSSLGVGARLLTTSFGCASRSRNG